MDGLRVEVVVVAGVASDTDKERERVVVALGTKSA